MEGKIGETNEREKRVKNRSETQRTSVFRRWAVQTKSAGADRLRVKRRFNIFVDRTNQSADANSSSFFCETRGGLDSLPGLRDFPPNSSVIRENDNVNRDNDALPNRDERMLLLRTPRVIVDAIRKYFPRMDPVALWLIAFVSIRVSKEHVGFNCQLIRWNLRLIQDLKVWPFLSGRLLTGYLLYSFFFGSCLFLFRINRCLNFVVHISW